MIDQKRPREIKIRSKLKGKTWFEYVKKRIYFLSSKEKGFGSDFACTLVVNSQAQELSKQDTQIQLELKLMDSLNLTFTCEEKDYKVSSDKSGQGFDMLNTLIEEINDDERFPITLTIANPEIMADNSCKALSELQ